MAAGKTSKEGSGSKAETKVEVVRKNAATICGVKPPGPKYMLRTVVGYKDHCLSRLRNPAYTFGRRQTSTPSCRSPGPKYLLRALKQEGFTFGYPKKRSEACLSPGPKYDVRTRPKGPFYSMKWRSNYRTGYPVPAPYSLKSLLDGPAFSIGLRWKSTACTGTPGPQNLFDLNVTKPRAPLYSLADRQTGKPPCLSPGPKYYPKPVKPTPIYSFGIRHSECAPPYIVECDEKC